MPASKNFLILQKTCNIFRQHVYMSTGQTWKEVCFSTRFSRANCAQLFYHWRMTKTFLCQSYRARRAGATFPKNIFLQLLLITHNPCAKVVSKEHTFFYVSLMEFSIIELELHKEKKRYKKDLLCFCRRRCLKFKCTRVWNKVCTLLQMHHVSLKIWHTNTKVSGKKTISYSHTSTFYWN